MAGLYLFEELYQEIEEENYRIFLQSLSTTAQFEDDVWICDLRDRAKGIERKQITIYFTNTPENHKEMVKVFTVLRMIDGNGVTSAGNGVYKVNGFLKFIDGMSLTEVNLSTVCNFTEYLKEKGFKPSTISDYYSVLNKFFRKMNGYHGLDLQNPFHNQRIAYDRLHDSKYIPEFVAKQLDVAFMDERIPVTLRTIYWVLRLVPSRISEVLGMEINCVKPYDDHYVLIIPSFKQNGGYKEPIPRTIHFEDEGIGAYLMDLLKEQQKEARSVQSQLPKKSVNALFAYQSFRYEDGEYLEKNYFLVATTNSVSYQLKKICEIYEIRDKNGEIYRVTSHQFRHNGITDRILAGFTLPQIAEMTAHHGTAMIFGSYFHGNMHAERLQEPIYYEGEENHPYVLFRGRIMNMDTMKEARLLKNLRSHRVKGGICVDVTHCASGMWDCISCNQFVPEKEQLPFFQAQVEQWSEKAEKFKNSPQMKANFSQLAKDFQKLVDKLQGDE